VDVVVEDAAIVLEVGRGELEVTEVEVLEEMDRTELVCEVVSDAEGEGNELLGAIVDEELVTALMVQDDEEGVTPIA